MFSYNTILNHCGGGSFLDPLPSKSCLDCEGFSGLGGGKSGMLSSCKKHHVLWSAKKGCQGYKGKR